MNLVGNLVNSRIVEYIAKDGTKKSFITFTFYSKKTGYIPCKAFKLEVVNELRNLNLNDELEVLEWFPKKESWVDKNGLKQYGISLIVENLQIRQINNTQPVLTTPDLDNLQIDDDWDKDL